MEVLREIDFDKLPEICIQRRGGLQVQRRIVSAANRFGTITISDKVKEGLGLHSNVQDLVICSSRHYSPVMHLLMEEFKRLRSLAGEPKLPMACGDDQGFIDQFDNYWTREEAFIIATHADQINKTRDVVIFNDELFSENLY